MKIAGLIGLALSVCLLASLHTTSPQTSPSPIEQSYLLSQDQTLNADERIFYLIELCHKSPLLNAPSEKVREWSMALFNFDTADQNMRTVGQKNAVTSLSYVDPAAALDLLTRVSFERPAAGQWVYEDPRFNAAEKVFTNFLNTAKPHNFSIVTDKARYLGQTGQYPYWAMAEVIHHSPPPSRDEINKILTDALISYTDETGFYNRDEEFLYLVWGLKDLKDSGADKNLASRLVAAFVHHLTNDPTHIPGDYYAEVHIPSTAKVFPFTDRNAAFLFQAFPVIRQYNPALANQLSQQEPQLIQATENMSYVSGGFVQGDPRSEDAAEKHLQLLQASLIKRIKERRDCNPDSAEQLDRKSTRLNSSHRL